MSSESKTAFNLETNGGEGGVINVFSGEQLVFTDKGGWGAKLEFEGTFIKKYLC